MNLKNAFFIMIFLAISISLTAFVSADIIPINSHPLERCIKIVNLDDFPDLVLIGFYTGPMEDKYGAYIIEDGKCLTKGYKFNTLGLYWTTKEKFNSLDIKNLELDYKKVPIKGASDNEGNPAYMKVYFPTNLTQLLENLETYGDYVDESNPLVREDIEYSIAGYSDGKLIIYKSKQVSEYNNGQLNKTEVFEKPLINNEEPINPNPKIIPEPLPVKKGFWESISCFFKRLFGGSC